MNSDNAADALEQLDAAVEQWLEGDDQLIDAMGYALECQVSRNEVARRVYMLSRPTVLSVLQVIDRRNTVNRLLATAGIAVLTSDDTEEVWLLTVSKPRRGLQLHHDQNHLDDGGHPGTSGRAATAALVAARVVPVLYDNGYRLLDDKTPLDRADAQAAFGDPDAVLWVESVPQP